MGNLMTLPYSKEEKAKILTILIILPIFYIIFNKKKKQLIAINNNNLKKSDYHIVIDIQSVDTFVIKNSSWTVYVNKDSVKNVKLDAINPLDCILEGSQKFKTATVIGYFKRGKTFVINLINNINLPSGSKTKTKGLSIYISRVGEAVFIDTQGSNTPLPFLADENENEELKKAYNINESDGDTKLNNLHLARKKSTESFIQEVAIGLSNVVIFVVNELTWSDQQNIMALQKKIKSQDQQVKQRINTLFVFHNYMNVSNIEDLMAMVISYVTTPFKGYFHTEFIGEDYFFYYTDDENTNVTTHFFLCDHNTAFGKRWNELVCNHVRIKIKNVSNQNYAFDTILLETLTEKMKANIKVPPKLKIVPYNKIDTTVVKEPKKENMFIYIGETEIPLKDQFKLEKLEDIYHQVKPNTMDINQIAKYSIVPDIEVSQNKEQWEYALNNKDIKFIDNLLVVTGSYNPTYDRLECGETLIFTFDLPDIPEIDFSHKVRYDEHEKTNFLLVNGKRKLNYRSQKGTTIGIGDSGINEYPSSSVKICNSLNQRKDGEFDLRIPITPNYSLAYSNHFENGVLTLTFKKGVESEGSNKK